MQFNRISIAVILLVIIAVVLIFYILLKTDVDENMENTVSDDTKKIQQQNLKWNRNKCMFSFGSAFENVFDKNNIKQDSNKFDIYLPCNYDDLNKEINEMPIVDGVKYFILDGVDEFVAKNALWGNLVKHYGLARAKTYMPMTYELFINNDVEKFKREYDSKKIYIMKKNIQRQEGLLITNNFSEIISGKQKGYVVVQELLQNPYIIDGRKTNMRFYILIIRNKDKLKVLVYNDGFMYYTKVPFVKNSLDADVNITTGYIDREVYEKNPLTHGDLRMYLDKPDRILSPIEQNICNQGLRLSDVYFKRIYEMLRDIFLAFIGKFAKSDKLANNIGFQLFGIDVAVDDELNPMLLEVNKGPDLNLKDVRDGELKQKVVLDILKSIDTIENKDNGFFTILET
jgi:hypothetical protein